MYKLQVVEDDCSNDTDFLIDENVQVDELNADDIQLSQNKNGDTDDDDYDIDIPLSQVKNGDRMV